jgi:hypothetical protein
MSEFLMMCIGVFFGVTWAFSQVTEAEFAKGLELCQANGGMKTYTTGSIGSPKVRCNNGAYFTVKETE